MKCKKRFKIQLKPFSKQYLVLIPTNTSFQGQCKKSHKHYSSGPAPMKTQPGNYSCIFVCIRTVSYVRQLGLTFVLSNCMKPVWGYFMADQIQTAYGSCYFYSLRLKATAGISWGEKKSVLAHPTTPFSFCGRWSWTGFPMRPNVLPSPPFSVFIWFNMFTEGNFSISPNQEGESTGTNS